MTQKELLYLEDAIGHEKTMISVISETTNLLENQELIDYMKEEIKLHQQMEKKIMNILEEKANE